MIDNKDQFSLFQHRVTPYKHQLDMLPIMVEQEYYALFWEMGTGKSKTLLDNAAILFKEGKIDGLMIVAPKGAYLNWIFNEIPKHMSDTVDYYMAFWSAQMRKTEAQKASGVLRPEPGVLDIVCMNIEAFSCTSGRQYAEAFMARHKVLMCIDESTSIKNVKAMRTKFALQLGRLAKYRRIMTGSPITQSPLDLYSQCAFLKPGVLGHSSFFSFRNYYANIYTVRMGTRQFPKINGYRNIEELKRRLTAFSSRIMKEECLDLPEKTFSTLYIDLTPEQRDAYDSMRDLCVMGFGDGVVTVTSALTAITKLHQIACGHCIDDAGNMIRLPNNRLSALLETIEEVSGKIIVWCNFQQDVRDVRDALANAYGDDSAVTYYGGTSNDDRATAHSRFNKDATCRFLVASSAASKGLTLVSSHYNIYYSHSYNLENYLQSQDRTHRIGQVHNVHYLSVVARDTIDEKIVQALQAKKNIADMVMTNWREIL